jgi:hypothetical protein
VEVTRVKAADAVRELKQPLIDRIEAVTNGDPY